MTDFGTSSPAKPARVVEYPGSRTRAEISSAGIFHLTHNLDLAGSRVLHTAAVFSGGGGDCRALSSSHRNLFINVKNQSD